MTDRARYEVARQRDEYGGTNWGAGLLRLARRRRPGRAADRVGRAPRARRSPSRSFDSVGEAANNGDTIGIVGGICLLVIALIAYFAGGYVAGRMSRFDGGRQGLAVWIWSVAVVVVLAVHRRDRRVRVQPARPYRPAARSDRRGRPDHRRRDRPGGDPDRHAAGGDRRRQGRGALSPPRRRGRLRGRRGRPARGGRAAPACP